MTNNIGVMQGRLLPKYLGRYQAHPVNYWQDEFSLAKDIGLNCIEFILDLNEANDNPLIKKKGLDQIKAAIKLTGVSVKTVCADYLMEAPIHSKNSEVANYSKELLIKLLNRAQQLRITDIVIPCVDQSSLIDKYSQNRFVEKLLPALDLAEEFKINLSLETDLEPKAFQKLLNRFKSKRVTVNYDIGNSASLGFNPVEELDTYGEKITDIHIKDRVLGGGPVLLGSGNANFDIFFTKLQEFDYSGVYIMQAYRDEEGIDIFKKQLEWIKPFL
jgi:L-ribulose-5-phosphate 3-epimerase